MLFEQFFESIGLGRPSRTGAPITGYFYDKTIISKENLPVDYIIYLQNLKPNCKILKYFGLKLQVKGVPNNSTFSIAFQMLKNLFF